MLTRVKFFVFIVTVVFIRVTYGEEGVTGSTGTAGGEGSAGSTEGAMDTRKGGGAGGSAGGSSTETVVMEAEAAVTTEMPEVTIDPNVITKVNFLLFHESDHPKDIVELAKKFVNSKKDTWKIEAGEIYPFYSDHDTTQANHLIDEICKTYDSAMAQSKDKRPDFALDFTTQGISSEAVKVVLKTMKIPTIAGTYGQEQDIREWREIDSQNQNRYLIQVSPPADILVQSVRSLVDLQNMTSAVVLFDPIQYEMYHKYKALLQNMPTRHLLTKLKTDPKDIRKEIHRLVHVDIVNFFIAADVNQVSDVLALSSNPNATDGPYFSDEYAWYSMSLEPGIPHCKGCEIPVSVVHLSPMPMPEENVTEGAKERKEALKNEDKKVFDLDSLTDQFYFDLAVDAIIAVGNAKRNERKKLVLKFPMECTNYNEEMKGNETLEIDLYPYLIEAAKDNILPFDLSKAKNGLNFPLFRMKIERFIFNPKEEKPMDSKVVGFWQSGFDEMKAITFENGHDLVNHLAITVFRIVTVIQPPFVYLNQTCEDARNKTAKYGHCFYGYCLELLKYIQDDLKFQYTIRKVDTGYGYMKPEGQHEWTGMVRELGDRKADIALGAMSVMAERESVVDFTVPYYDLVGISILVRKPRVTTSLFKFLTVLENDVWMCILGAYFFTSLLMWIFDRWSPYSYQNNRDKFEEDDEKREFNLKECLWFCMTSLTPQGGGEAPKNLSGRLVAATWWLFGFIIIASYTANLAAFLTVSRLDTPVDSLEDLSKQYKVQYAPEENGSAWIYFDRMAHIEHRFYEIWKDMSLNDSLDEYERSQLAVWDYPVSDKFTKIWQAMVENGMPKSFKEGVERVRGDENSDAFAFLADATDVRYQELVNCEFKMIGEEFSRKPYALAVQQGSPLKDQLNDAILKLLNQRQLEQLKEKWWNDNPHRSQNCPKEDNQSDGISIHNIGGVFIVIFVGIIMACLTLVFEYWWYRKKDVAEELDQMAIPQQKSIVSGGFRPEKTDYNTLYDKPGHTALPTIENSW